MSRESDGSENLDMVQPSRGGCGWPLIITDFGNGNMIAMSVPRNQVIEYCKSHGLFASNTNDQRGVRTTEQKHERPKY